MALSERMARVLAHGRTRRHESLPELWVTNGAVSKSLLAADPEPSPLYIELIVIDRSLVRRGREQWRVSGCRLCSLKVSGANELESQTGSQK